MRSEPWVAPNHRTHEGSSPEKRPALSAGGQARSGPEPSRRRTQASAPERTTRAALRTGRGASEPPTPGGPVRGGGRGTRKSQVRAEGRCRPPGATLDPTAGAGRGLMGTLGPQSGYDEVRARGQDRAAPDPGPGPEDTGVQRQSAPLPPPAPARTPRRGCGLSRSRRARPRGGAHARQPLPGHPPAPPTAL